MKATEVLIHWSKQGPCRHFSARWAFTVLTWLVLCRDLHG